MKNLIIAALIAAPFIAYSEGQTPGGTPPAALSRTGRVLNYHIPSVRMQTSPATAGTCTVNSSTVSPGVGMGRDGWVMDAAFSSVAITWTSSIGVPTYPSRLLIDFYDAAATGTLACTSLTLSGYRWDGKQVTEIIRSLSETAQYTTNSYSSLTRVAAAGCSGWSDASSDRLRIRTSGYVALPWRVTRYQDIDSICAAPTLGTFTVAQTLLAKCLKPGATNFTYDLSPAANAVFLNKAESYLAVSGANLSGTGAGCALDRSAITIRARASEREFGY